MLDITSGPENYPDQPKSLKAPVVSVPMVFDELVDNIIGLSDKWAIQADAFDTAAGFPNNSPEANLLRECHRDMIRMLNAIGVESDD